MSRHVSFAPDPVALKVPMTAEEIDQSRSIIGLTRLMWKAVNPGVDSKFVDSWHYGCLAEHYEELLRPTSCMQNLCVMEPPRVGKSLSLVMMFSFAWLKYPWMRFLFASHANSLVIRDSLLCRDVVTSPRYRSVAGSKIQLRIDQNTQKRFTNSQQGFRLGVTVGAGLGEGADVLVADDTLDPKKSRSALARDALIYWWRSTFRQRMTDPAKTKRLVVQQRVHKGDLPGYLFEAEKSEWDFLILPMEYEPRRMTYLLPPTEQPANDPIPATRLQEKRPELQDGPSGSGRKEHGDLLWPDRFPRKVVDSMKASLGRDAPGQLAQRPQDESGSVFRVDRANRYEPRFNQDGTLAAIALDHRAAQGTKMIQRVIPAERWRWYQTMDTALTAKTYSSYTAIGTFALSDVGDLVVWDMFTERLEVPDQFPTIQLLKLGPVIWNQNAGALQPSSWPFLLTLRFCEPKASAFGIMQASYTDATPILPIKGIPGDKVTRSTQTALMYQAGKMFHPHPGPLWLEALEEELRLFPNGDANDRVDVMSYAGILASTDALLRAHMRRPLTHSRSPEARASARAGVIEDMLKEAGVVDIDLEELPEGATAVMLDPGNPEADPPVPPTYHVVERTEGADRGPRE